MFIFKVQFPVLSAIFLLIVLIPGVLFALPVDVDPGVNPPSTDLNSSVGVFGQSSSPAVINILGVESLGASPHSLLFLPPASLVQSVGSFIPAKSGGSPITFSAESESVEQKVPSSAKVSFEPHLDTGDFTNFASATVVEDRIVRKEQINGGTCFGLSYFTAIYYSRLIRPVQLGKDPVLFRNYDIDFNLWDALTKDLSNVGQAPTDGIEYLVKEVWDEKSSGTGKLFWSSMNLKYHLHDYRLRKMSGTFSKEIKIGAISHHNDQHSVDRVWFDASKGSELEGAVKTIGERIEANGTQAFFFRHFILGDKWYSWDKFDWGHACLLYRISTFEVKSSDDKVRTAWKLHFYDPNTNYRDGSVRDTGEGYGDYLIYFPDSKQITFSQRMIKRYDMQSNTSVIDNRQEKIGYYDIYEGHPIQEKIAKNAYMKSYVGLGRVLEDDEKELAEKNGKVKLDEDQPLDDATEWRDID